MVTEGVGLGIGTDVRLGVGSDEGTVGVDVTDTARVALSVGVIEVVFGDKVRVARRGVAVEVDVALGVAVAEGVRVVLDVGVSDGTAVAVGKGSGVALGEGDGEGVSVAARVGNCTATDTGVTG
jgi:hypothetical protein